MLNISEIVAKAEAMFDLFNDHFYAGEMARPTITVSPDGGRGGYGWCSVYVRCGSRFLPCGWTGRGAGQVVRRDAGGVALSTRLGSV